VSQWVGLPLWIDGNFLTTDNSKIKTDYGFKFNKIEVTVNSLLKYYSSIKKWEDSERKDKRISRKIESDLIEKIKTVHNLT